MKKIFFILSFFTVLFFPVFAGDEQKTINIDVKKPVVIKIPSLNNVEVKDNDKKDVEVKDNDKEDVEVKDNDKKDVEVKITIIKM